MRRKSRCCSTLQKWRVLEGMQSAMENCYGHHQEVLLVCQNLALYFSSWQKFLHVTRICSWDKDLAYHCSYRSWHQKPCGDILPNVSLGSLATAVIHWILLRRWHFFHIAILANVWQSSAQDIVDNEVISFSQRLLFCIFSCLCQPYWNRKLLWFFLEVVSIPVRQLKIIRKKSGIYKLD